MRRMWRSLATVAMGLSGPAMAADAVPEPAGEIFIKPGVLRDVALADFDECRELASAVRAPAQTPVGTSTLIGVGVVALIQGAAAGSQRRKMVDISYRKCLSIKGYGRYALDADAARSVYAGAWDSQRVRLAELAVRDPGKMRRMDP